MLKSLSLYAAFKGLLIVVDADRYASVNQVAHDPSVSMIKEGIHKNGFGAMSYQSAWIYRLGLLNNQLNKTN